MRGMFLGGSVRAASLTGACRPRSLHASHPLRADGPGASASRSELLQGDDGLFKVLTFRPQFGEHCSDVH